MGFFAEARRRTRLGAITELLIKPKKALTADEIEYLLTQLAELATNKEWAIFVTTTETKSYGAGELLRRGRAVTYILSHQELREIYRDIVIAENQQGETA